MIKPQPEGAEEEEQEEQGALDAMGSHRDLPLQVGFKIFFLRHRSVAGVRGRLSCPWKSSLAMITIPYSLL